ncbi:MAG: hypothetical protein M3169_10570 [Candidatus Eremiobacteraeota bacterium]|nr:hypothetical protein [Candidatus Eremiobacteraeota bacterium]
MSGVALAAAVQSVVTPFAYLVRLYFANARLGLAFSLVTIAAVPAAALHVRRTGMPREDVFQFALTFAVGAFYLAVLYVPSRSSTPRSGSSRNARTTTRSRSSSRSGLFQGVLVRRHVGTRRDRHDARGVRDRAGAVRDLAAALAELPPAWYIAILTLQALDVAVTWIGGSLPDAWRTAPSIDPVTVAFAAASASAVALLLVRYAGQAVAATEKSA